MLGARTVAADTRFVATNGADSPTCGGKTAPCRSIGRAVQNADPGDTIEVGPGRYGDIDADGIFTTPGDEQPQIDLGCDCLVEIDRSLTVVSRDGAGATVIDAGNAPVSVVRVTADRVTFGKKGKGFTLTGSSNSHGFACQRNDVTIRGNRAVGNGGLGIEADGNAGFIVLEDNVAEANGSHGFRLDDADVKIVQRNVAVGNGDDGFSIGNGASAVVNANLATENDNEGFHLPARTSAKGNVALDNDGTGFVLGDDSTLVGSVSNGNRRGIDLQGGTVVSKSAVLGNHGYGIVVRGLGSTITKTSIFGNDTFGDSTDSVPGPFFTNCGVQSLVATVAVAGSFWGAATGPGDDPADALCKDGVAVVDAAVEPVAAGEIKVKPKAAR